MTLFAFADLLTGYFGKDLVINEFIYNSFVVITLGSFGVAEVGKIFGKKGQSKKINNDFKKLDQEEKKLKNFKNFLKSGRMVSSVQELHLQLRNAVLQTVWT